MEKFVLMIFTILLSLSAFGQKYSKVLDQAFEASDLEYMPISELRLLKNEIIATKGSDVIRTKNNDKAIVESPKPFLDKSSEANIELITKLETSLMDKDSTCSDMELYKYFIESIKHKQSIPFYLQTLFFSNCQSPKSNIYLVPVSEKFNTVAISEKPMIGPEFHKVYTFDLEGKKIDFKSMNGKAQFKENKIIHESFNSLIEYTYTIDEDGKFDRKTPTKE